MCFYYLVIKLHTKNNTPQTVNQTYLYAIPCVPTSPYVAHVQLIQKKHAVIASCTILVATQGSSVYCMGVMIRSNLFYREVQSLSKSYPLLRSPRHRDHKQISWLSKMPSVPCCPPQIRKMNNILLGTFRTHPRCSARAVPLPRPTSSIARRYWVRHVPGPPQHVESLKPSPKKGKK